MSKTIEEIAADNKVSVTTVKLVINGTAQRYRISKQTQNRIQDYINKHGYRVNQVARSLKLKKSQTLGLIIPKLTNPFFAQLAGSIEQYCVKHEYQVIIASTHDKPEQEQIVTDHLLDRGVDGLFVVSCSQTLQQKIAREAQHQNKALVFLDQDFGISNLAMVTSNNYQSSLEMTTKVLQQSGNDLYFIYGDTQLPSMQYRLHGFINAHRQLNRPYQPDKIISLEHNSAQEAFFAIKQIYDQHGAIPDGLIFSSLPLLEGALHFINQQLSNIPASLTIGTFDNYTMLEFLPNHLFSVYQNPNKMAEVACALLFSQIKAPEIFKPVRKIIKSLVIEHLR